MYFVDLSEQSVYRFHLNDELKAIAYEHGNKTYFPLYYREMVIERIGQDSLAALRAAAAYTPKVKQPITF